GSRSGGSRSTIGPVMGRRTLAHGSSTATAPKSPPPGASRTSIRTLLGAAIVALSLAASIGTARAEENTRLERAISETLAQSHEEAATGTPPTWTILPQIGYDPEALVSAGIKVRNGNLLDSGAFLDVNAIVSINHRNEAAIAFGEPHIADTPFLA